MVIEGVAVHRANQANVVDHLRRMRQPIADFDAAFAMPLEHARAGHDLGARFDESQLQVSGERFRKRLAVPLAQSGLGIEEIHLARGARLEQENDVLRRGFKVGLSGRERVRSPDIGFRRAAFDRKQMDKARHAQTAQAAVQKIAARPDAMKVGKGHADHSLVMNSSVLSRTRLRPTHAAASRLSTPSMPAGKSEASLSWLPASSALR